MIDSMTRAGKSARLIWKFFKYLKVMNCSKSLNGSMTKGHKGQTKRVSNGENSNNLSNKVKNIVKVCN